MHNAVCLLISGGIDSAIAAYLLLQNGYSVHALHLNLFSTPAESQQKAKKIASFFHLPFSVLNLEEKFSSCVIQSTIQSYKNGLTPNPCIECNPLVKFGTEVQTFAKENSLDFIATGHYAKIQQVNQFHYLAKARDEKKDQSYFLYRLPSMLYPKFLFPLGDSSKTEVRNIASQIGLQEEHVSKESNDLCFYDGSYRDFAKMNIPSQKGDIVSESGELLGHHDGYFLYTIGQRQGLGVSHSQPLYVKEIDAVHNRICLATREKMMSTSFDLKDPIWHLQKGEVLPNSLAVKVRYRSPQEMCSIHPSPPYKVRLHTPMFAITPGQSAVFYVKDRVIGGGFIA
ncbi:MAG TPA: tRNA 2-thiouridine(34) synthase MnmA [Caldisericia bacterium]|nr:tRNA 2-thiouridine(34) synthase MnmA [Caldisericia bacterium]